MAHLLVGRGPELIGNELPKPLGHHQLDAPNILRPLEVELNDTYDLATLDHRNKNGGAERRMTRLNIFRILYDPKLAGRNDILGQVGCDLFSGINGTAGGTGMGQEPLRIRNGDGRCFQLARQGGHGLCGTVRQALLQMRRPLPRYGMPSPSRTRSPALPR